MNLNLRIHSTTSGRYRNSQEGRIVSTFIPNIYIYQTLLIFLFSVNNSVNSSSCLTTKNERDNVNGEKIIHILKSASDLLTQISEFRCCNGDVSILNFTFI